jgi:predicted TPR repeat methyltransferase
LSNRRKLGLDDAYGVETPEDNVRLYAEWASTYEDDFVAAYGYVLHLRVVERLAKMLTERDAPVLDIGCGTGIGGLALRELGFHVVDGVDISRSMLDMAAAKHLADGVPAYRNLHQADLTIEPALPYTEYAGLMSAGTFTHGHLGADSLELVWQLARAGGVAAIAVNANHYESEGFAAAFAAGEAAGVIGVIDAVDAAIYERPPPDLEPGNELAIVVTCRVN